MAAMLFNAPLLKAFRRLGFFLAPPGGHSFASFCLTMGAHAQTERRLVDRPGSALYGNLSQPSPQLTFALLGRSPPTWAAGDSSPLSSLKSDIGFQRPHELHETAHLAGPELLIFTADDRHVALRRGPPFVMVDFLDESAALQ